MIAEIKTFSDFISAASLGTIGTVLTCIPCASYLITGNYGSVPHCCGCVGILALDIAIGIEVNKYLHS